MFQKNYISHYIKKSGCDKCIAEKYRFENFISEANKIHNNLYDYFNAKKVWKNYTTTIPITCQIHGDFNMLPHNHLKNQGCSKCSLSKGEKRIANYLDSKNISYKQFHKFDDCRYKRKLIFDFYIEHLNMCIEYDGIHHFQNVKRFDNDLEITQIRDNIKNMYCLSKGIVMLRIPYISFDNIEAILNDIIK